MLALLLAEGTAVGAACSKSGADWVRLPMSQAEYLRAYPAKARRKLVPGVGVVSCRVAADGRPEDCVIISEEPPGLGFGEGALKLSAFFRFRPPCAGEPARVTVPIKFVPGE
ncbi:MAG TPA: TonB family protein [Phenylobacterium sp.]